MELAELLQWVAQSRQDRDLVIGRGEVQKRIFFLDGRIIATGSPTPRSSSGTSWSATATSTSRSWSRPSPSRRRPGCCWARSW
jgi:hypothetical protein